MIFWKDYDFSFLNISPTIKPPKKKAKTLSKFIITADTETSKSEDKNDNHIVIWAIHLRLDEEEVVTLYGRKPSDFPLCVEQIKLNVPAEQIYIFFHNLGYDWVFLRKFLIEQFEEPINQLNLKPYSPLYIEFLNGVILKDSLPLASRKLEKWAKDLNCKNQKMAGDWDYNVIRDQNTKLSNEELGYMEMDVVVLAECIYKTMRTLNCNLSTLPLTKTGIPRRDIRYIGKNHRAKRFYNSCLLTYDDYCLCERIFHGGYTHANRWYVGEHIKDHVYCYDFSSSYPARLILSKYPVGPFMKIENMTVDKILKHSENHAFIFTLLLIKPIVKKTTVMPVLQFSKAEKCINPVIDNGRLLECDYIKISLTEVDLKIIAEQYDYEKAIIINCRTARKGYLPKWLTDYIYEKYSNKCTLKNGDPVVYLIEKEKLNAIYGMHVQKCVRFDITENYETGEYVEDVSKDPEELYAKYTRKWSTILPYQFGVYCTAYAMAELFELGKMCDEWVYSDTDSIYCIGPHFDEIENYNNNIRNQLIERGYGPVMYDGKEYVVGIAEPDGEYTEFKTLGSKRYVCRKLNDDLKLTVAGVPKKKGAECLKDDISNFVNGFIFDGATTGKLTHEHIIVDEIYVDEKGNEVGDSINLYPCDYTLDTARIDDLFTETIEGVTVYE